MTASSPRVLLVDDCPAIVRALAREFGRAGYEVLTTADGHQAMDAARRYTFDAAVVDYRIPGPDGLDVLSQLVEAQPRSIRVLATGSLDMDVAVQAVNRGRVSHVVSKPYTPRSIVDTVRAALTQRARVEKDAAVANENDCASERDQLIECFDDDMLQLAIQPIVSASRHESAAVEVLLRSSHPLLRGPAEVLRAAERHQLLPQLGDRVAQLAARWCRELPASMKVFINLHPHDLRDPDALRERMKPLRPFAGRVVAEITERAELPHPELRDRSLGVISDAGFAIAVDDLGAGYNALAMLASLNPEYVKIDMSIVRHIDESPRKQQLMRLLCDYAGKNDAVVVAEGVETEREALAARACGASLLQGYLFGRPHMSRAA